MSNIHDAKKALDELIGKARIHLYKPIQVAEILYHHRTQKNINLLNLEDYRNKSKQWRDEISLLLLGRVCTSSAKYQDNLFEKNVLPPELLNILGKENKRTHGAVEAYIYNAFLSKHMQLSNALDYCLRSDKQTFQVQKFLDSFQYSPGLKRSLDKVYEIIVYALFATLVDALNLKVQIYVDQNQLPLLEEFESFSKKVMALDISKPQNILSARLFRVGVTNAADRGIDMYSNWGPAIQIKHLALDEELAEDIVKSISSDRIVIVCKEAEQKIIVSLLNQIGWKSKIQSVITEDELICWYDKALRGKYAKLIGDKLLTLLSEEINNEFPSIDRMPHILANRNYEIIKDSFWK